MSKVKEESVSWQIFCRAIEVLIRFAFISFGCFLLWEVFLPSDPFSFWFPVGVFIIAQEIGNHVKSEVKELLNN